MNFLIFLFTALLSLSCPIYSFAKDRDSSSSPSRSEKLDQLLDLNYLWHQEFKPTIENSFDNYGQLILGTGTALTILSHQYDGDVYRFNKDDSRKYLSSEVANFGGSLGSGTPGIAIALAQLFFDTPEGIAHAKAIILTATTHISMASIVQRERPSKRNKLSFPSGHTSSSFATATSLAYSYGYKAGIPAYIAASFVGVSRINENIHWLSDVVAGAALGIYWGRASALNTSKETYTLLPSLSHDYAGLSFHLPFP